MNDIVREFLVETHESLAQLDRDLVALERTPGDAETLARVFRTFHTVKGTAGFLGLTKLEAVGHTGENLLARVRAGERTFGPDVATALLGVVDSIRAMLAALEATGGEGDAGHPAAAGSPGSVAPAAESLPPTEARSAAAETSVRVDVGLLDHLMTLVGELVLARNQLVQSPDPHGGAFAGALQRLDQLTAALQDGVMKTRMRPVGAAWAPLPRVVRDLAAAVGKRARLDTAGDDTELDRAVVEAIKDPLTHLIRNAVDHGLEPPAARAAAGKPAEGRLRLRAAHEGGAVVVELADDGAGIDPGRVRDAAVAARLVTPEQAAAMPDDEAVGLIFRPGFSTAGRVTRLSGRGVGMDVVRANVEKVGGTVEVTSTPGRGTTVRMRVPLTLAIVPALLVSAGGDRYAIPQPSLLELVRVEPESAPGAVESLHGAPVFRLRGNLLPVVALAAELGVETRPADAGLNVVVLQAGDRRFGLLVDHLHDVEEIVVKPLPEQLAGVRAYSGATILGDGRVALILDVLGLAQRARVVRGGRVRAAAAPPAAPPADRPAVLLFDAPDGARMAVPAARVARLEEFPAAAVEGPAGRPAVQYRGGVLPLARVCPDDGADPLRVVVLAAGADRVGLVVGRVVDIVQEAVTARAKADRPGVLFRAVVLGRITEFVDADALLGRTAPASGFVTLPTE